MSLMLSKFDKALTVLGVTVSLLGLSIALIMVFNPPPKQAFLTWRKPLTWLVFSIICILGVLATIFPQKCSKPFYRPSKTHYPAASRSIQGHHPDCEAFSTHVIKIRGRTLCAACTGLLIGGVIALMVSALYFSEALGIESGLQTILIGAIGVILIFLKPRLPGILRLTVNALFPIAASLILIGVDRFFENLFVNMFLNALIVFWIMTRIIISRWNHLKTCVNCKTPCTP